jgi:hypothetical protein
VTRDADHLLDSLADRPDLLTVCALLDAIEEGDLDPLQTSIVLNSFVDEFAVKVLGAFGRILCPYCCRPIRLSIPCRLCEGRRHIGDSEEGIVASASGNSGY